MSNSLNPVFGEWYTDKQIGTGTDGKVFSIYKEKYDGTRENAVLKIIRLGENRNERKVFDLSEKENETVIPEGDDDYEGIIKTIQKNVDSLMKTDKGKRFVKYEGLELRKASDGKSRLILIKLEEARSLTGMLKSFSLTLDESIRLGINICQSLIKCREFGYIYPNLKPENILFDRSGRCKLGDFGTFGCLEPAKTSIAYKRTQYYMAPEVIKTGNMNCTVDTYSLGLILYMLTNRNRLPFTAPYPEDVTINSLNSATEIRLSGAPLERPVYASDELWQIISKACSYNINERYFTPQQMLSDLKNALEKKPFEKAVYDEVYSVAPSDKEYEAEQTVSVEKVEEVKKTVEQVTPSLSLREEISIPVVSPKYQPKKKVEEKKKTVRYAKLPEIKKPKPKTAPEMKKIFSLAIAAAVLLILLIISLVMRASAADAQMLLTVACTEELDALFGGVLWLLT